MANTTKSSDSSSTTKTTTPKTTSTSSTKKTTSTSSGSKTTKSTTSSATSTAKKTVTKKANTTVNNATNSLLDNIKTKDGKSVTSNKTVKTTLNKISMTAKIIAIVLFVVGGLLGAFLGIRICKDDTFELIPCQTSFEIGAKNTIEIEGAKLVSFGKDISDKVNIEVSDGLILNDDGTITITDTSVEGTYYIVYTTKNYKYKNIRKIRYIYVVDVTESGESTPLE